LANARSEEVRKVSEALPEVDTEPVPRPPAEETRRLPAVMVVPPLKELEAVKFTPAVPVTTRAPEPLRVLERV
jgi:hypothetical protein